MVDMKEPRKKMASNNLSKGKAKSLGGSDMIKPSKAKTVAPRPAPAFLSALQNEEVDFPRGGGSSLTPLELKQSQVEGRREADAEATASIGKRRRSLSEREAKRLRKESPPKRKHEDSDTIRVEQLNYKRLTPGTRVLARVRTVLPLHLILSLPNSLLAHVPITEVSTTLTNLLSAEEEEMLDAVSSSSSSSSSPPDLSDLFLPGQYVAAKVLNTYPTASQSFISQYPVSETTRLAAKTEMTLIPDKVNSEIAKADIQVGYNLSGEVLSREDKGWRIGLGLNEDLGGAGVEGWLDLHSNQNLVLGQLVSATVSAVKAGGRVIHLNAQSTTVAKAQLSEISDIGSVLPGQLVSALVTAVLPSGLNVKICAFYNGTIELSHLDLGDKSIEEKYSAGKKIRARIIYDSASTGTKRFSLSNLPHVISLGSATAPQQSTSLEDAVVLGKIFSVTVTRVISEWGVVCKTDDGISGFVHISHISDDRLPALSGNTGTYKVGTLHRARVIGHSPMDGILLLSFEQKVLEQAFMRVDDLRIGQSLKGTIHRLTDKALFVNIQGSVDGIVWPVHYADIRLKHPEKRFKVGSTVKARVFSVEPARSRVVLTLKKSLVESDLPVVQSFDELRSGTVTAGIVFKILDKGLLVDIFGGVKAFVPIAETSTEFVTNLAEHFFVGKSVTVRITSVDVTSQKLLASIRQALPTALAAEKLDVGDVVSGVLAQVHPEQVFLTLQPSQLPALLSLSNLSNHRALAIDELRASLKSGDVFNDLVIVSKSSTSGGPLIVANKRNQTQSIPSSGVSQPSRKIDLIKPGAVVSGRVSTISPLATIVQLTTHLRGRLHPLDMVDDLSLLPTLDRDVDDQLQCYVLAKSHRSVDLSTRPSQLNQDNAPEPVDPEINDVKDVKEGMKIRGLVKNVSSHGIFVALGRSVSARVMIKELFDEFVKDWQTRFEVGQLVAGKILSVNPDKALVEMTLRQNPVIKGNKKVAQLGVSDFSEGQKVIATVKKVEAYGIFLRIENTEISGLCHRSELSDNKTHDVSKALKGFREGDQVKAVITEIDQEKRRLNFSIKPSRFSDEFGMPGAADEGDTEEEDEEDVREDESGGENEEEDQGKGSSEAGEGEGEVSLNDLLEADDSDDGVDGGQDGDSSDDEDVQLEFAKGPPTRSIKGSIASNGADSIPQVTAPRPIAVPGGFDWSADDDESDAESSTSSMSLEVETPSSLKSKAKQKSSILNLGTATAPNDRPETTTDFERALLASPNSSFLWIQYMSFQLQLHEVEKARKIGRKALDKIAFREEEEKLNVWMALVNLELGFGTADSAEKVFKEAVQHNDAKTVYLRYADALSTSGKEELAEETYQKLVKKFSQQDDVWVKFAEWQFKRAQVDEARELLARSMKSLDRTKHLDVISKFAIMEFKHADAERGKTLFEELVDRYPKRLDLWSIYIDQLSKPGSGEIQTVRGLFDRALNHKMTSKKAKFLFKKWLAIETRIGDVAGEETAKQRARDWVAANVRKDEAEEEEE